MVQSCGDAPDNPNTSTSTLLTTPTDGQIYTAIGEWLKTVLPAGMEIMQGQQNQTASPIGPFCVMLIVTRRRLATNGWTYTDTARLVTNMVELTVQISVFGNDAEGAIDQVQSLWRDFYATDFMAANSYPVSPLSTSDPRQMQFVNGERQYENAWSVDLKAQVNFTTAVPQQFADQIKVTTIPADLPPTQE